MTENTQNTRCSGLSAIGGERGAGLLAANSPEHNSGFLTKLCRRSLGERSRFGDFSLNTASSPLKDHWGHFGTSLKDDRGGT